MNINWDHHPRKGFKLRLFETTNQSSNIIQWHDQCSGVFLVLSRVQPLIDLILRAFAKGPPGSLDLSGDETRQQVRWTGEHRVGQGLAW